MLEESNRYFKYCDTSIIDKWIAGKISKPKTLSWLCLWLWVSKDYISEKAKDETYSETIKEIRMNVENCIEEWILTWLYNPTSGIFNLKNNFDWKDKIETDNTTKTIDISDDLTPEQKAKIAKQYQ